MNINLVLIKTDGSRKIFPLPSSVTVIGRRDDCDLRIPLMNVSRRHCQLNYSDGVLRIRDLGSRNGTYLNGERVDEAEVRPGDSNKVGPLTFVFQIDGQPGDITQPSRAAQDLPQDSEATKDLSTDDFDTLAELNGLNDLDSLDNADSA